MSAEGLTEKLKEIVEEKGLEVDPFLVCLLCVSCAVSHISFTDWMVQ